jgi:type IV pilus assembly protein PilW
MHTLSIDNAGFSLVELLVGIAIGLVVATAMISFLMATSKASTQTLQTVRLEYELKSAINLIADDIRRAGFYASSRSMVDTGINSNPFMSVSTDITTPNSSCILFSYDLNSDGLLPSLGFADSDERFGYRLSNQIIQSRATTDANFSCTSGSWENITNPNLIQVTNLTFSLTNTTVALDSPSSGSIVLRQVLISATAALSSDPSVSRTMTSQVKVRNDKYEP